MTYINLETGEKTNALNLNHKQAKFHFCPRSPLLRAGKKIIQVNDNALLIKYNLMDGKYRAWERGVENKLENMGDGKKCIIF
jgi:hypothetical protein